jgi:acylphosphatase
MIINAARIVVSGRVQGVGFRWFSRAQADVLGLSGWARNRRDGTVEIEVRGARARIEACIERLRGGPPGSVVAQVDVAWLPDAAAPRSTGFEIRATR